MLDRELVEAVKVAREAGAILLSVYRTDFAVELKGQSDPVTEADKRANELIVARLREAFPHDGIVAEESTDHGDALKRTRCWFVDPLDGTKEFIAKNGEFSVMIGLAVDGVAQLGVVYRPVDNKLYRGVVGDSAFVEIDDRTHPLAVSKIADPSALRLVVSRSHRSDATDALIERLGIDGDEMRSGSVGLKIGLIAQKQADLYVHLSGRSSAWDACAPDAILRASGGRFTDLGGKSIAYQGPELRCTRGLLACNAVAFERVLPVVSALAIEKGVIEAEKTEP